MVNYSLSLDNALNSTFAALADPTRRAMLARLAEGETSVSDLGRPFAMSLPAVLKHVDALTRAGLLEARKEGRVRRCRLRAAPLGRAVEWIDHYRRFWDVALDNLGRYLAETPDEEETPWPTDPFPRPRSPSASPAPTRRAGRGSSARGRTRRR